MKSKIRPLLILAMLNIGFTARSSTFSLRAGPQQIGNGGSYPMWLPPFGVDQYGVTYVTQSNFETTISIYPGLLFGQRFQTDGVFVSLGGGLIIGSSNGPGIYSTFGYETGGGSVGCHFTMDYTQAVGYASKEASYFTSSSMRFGALWRF